MVAPWVGLPLADLLKRFKPTSKAKYVAFYTLFDPQQMPDTARGVLNWPYREGLRIDEAMHPLAFLSVGLYGRIARWLHLRVYGSLAYDSAHFLTHEDIGEDKDNDGLITISQGSGKPAPDQNPNYDFRLDPVGRRLRAEPALIWGVAGTISLNF